MIYAYFLTICVKIHNNSMTIAFTGVVKLIFDMNVIEKNHVMMRFKKRNDFSEKSLCSLQIV